ncbi:hypothetical protein H4R20_003825, partial [Coemansia guatemalensis]
FRMQAEADGGDMSDFEAFARRAIDKQQQHDKAKAAIGSISQNPHVKFHKQPEVSVPVGQQEPSFGPQAMTKILNCLASMNMVVSVNPMTGRYEVVERKPVVSGVIQSNVNAAQAYGQQPAYQYPVYQQPYQPVLQMNPFPYQVPTFQQPVYQQVTGGGQHVAVVGAMNWPTSCIVCKSHEHTKCGCEVLTELKHRGVIRFNDLGHVVFPDGGLVGVNSSGMLDAVEARNPSVVAAVMTAVAARSANPATGANSMPVAPRPQVQPKPQEECEEVVSRSSLVQSDLWVEQQVNNATVCGGQEIWEHDDTLAFAADKHPRQDDSDNEDGVMLRSGRRARVEASEPIAGPSRDVGQQAVVRSSATAPRSAIAQPQTIRLVVQQQVHPAVQQQVHPAAVQQ